MAVDLTALRNNAELMALLSQLESELGAAGSADGKDSAVLGSTIDSELNALLSDLKTTPTLVPSTSGLSLENMLEAIGNTTRRNSVKAGVNDIETKGQEIKEQNDKQLEEIKKRLDEMKSKGILNGFLKAFKIIGAILGAVAAVASIATGNPLLIAAGVTGILMTLDSISSTISDGKVSIAAGFTALGKACGMSDETAEKFGTYLSLGISLACVAFSLGAAFHSSTQAFAKLGELASKINQWSNVANAVTGVGSGATTIAGAVIDSSISNSQARSKEIDAVLEKIRQAIEFEQDIIKAEMDRAEELVDDVEDIVENCNSAQAAILAENPSMA